MDRKKFFLTTIVIIVAAVVSWVVKYRQPTLTDSADWSTFPLQSGEWVGETDVVSQGVIDLLQPSGIFNANYFRSDGIQINLFLGDWLDAHGGPHSPLNCLPASGWAVVETQNRPIPYGSRQIPARRLRLQYGQVFYVMDFWYITPFGETSNDYRLKLDEMLTSLMLQPRHLTFVRFVTRDTEAGRAALDQFEQDFVDEIYQRLPVESL
jgi:EpsI family protein